MLKKFKYRTDARRRYRWQSLFKSVLNKKMNECVAECCICRGWSWRYQATCPTGRIWATPLHPAASVLECLPPRLVKAASSQSAAGSGLLRHCCRPPRNRLTGSPRPPKTLAKRNASSKGLIACFKSNGTKTFFSSNVKNNKSMHVALILTHKGGRGSFMFWTGCQVPQWKCFHGKNYVKKDTWHHMWALKVVASSSPPNLRDDYLQPSPACMLHQTPVIYLCAATHTHTPWSSVSCADLSLTEHHLFTTVCPLQRRARWEAEPPAEQTEVSRQLLEAPVSVPRPGSNRWSTNTHALPLWVRSVRLLWLFMFDGEVFRKCWLCVDHQLGAVSITYRWQETARLSLTVSFSFTWCKNPPLIVMHLIVIVQLRP